PADRVLLVGDQIQGVGLGVCEGDRVEALGAGLGGQPPHDLPATQAGDHVLGRGEHVGAGAGLGVVLAGQVRSLRLPLAVGQNVDRGGVLEIGDPSVDIGDGTVL